jgi:hypothetical protein
MQQERQASCNGWRITLLADSSVSSGIRVLEFGVWHLWLSHAPGGIFSARGLLAFRARDIHLFLHVHTGHWHRLQLTCLGIRHGSDLGVGIVSIHVGKLHWQIERQHTKALQALQLLFVVSQSGLCQNGCHKRQARIGTTVAPASRAHLRALIRVCSQVFSMWQRHAR